MLGKHALGLQSGLLCCRKKVVMLRATQFVRHQYRWLLPEARTDLCQHREGKSGDTYKLHILALRARCYPHRHVGKSGALRACELNNHSYIISPEVRLWLSQPGYGNTSNAHTYHTSYTQELLGHILRVLWYSYYLEKSVTFRACKFSRHQYIFTDIHPDIRTRLCKDVRVFCNPVC